MLRGGQILTGPSEGRANVFALAAFTVVALFFLGLAALVLWLVLLPFRILGLVLRGIALLLWLPVLILFCVIGALIFGFGALVFLVPALPLALLALLVWWLMRRRGQSSATVSS